MTRRWLLVTLVLSLAGNLVALALVATGPLRERWRWRQFDRRLRCRAPRYEVRAVHDSFWPQIDSAQRRYLETQRDLSWVRLAEELDTARLRLVLARAAAARRQRFQAAFSSCRAALNDPDQRVRRRAERLWRMVMDVPADTAR